MIYIHAFSLINALGSSDEEISHHLMHCKSGLKPYTDLWLQNNDTTYLGKIDNTLPIFPDNFPEHHSRNNQLLLHCLQAIQKDVEDLLKQYDKSKIAIILGTSTSGIFEGEEALKAELQGHQSQEFHYQQQCFSDPSDFLAKYLNITGPHYTISTACSSSARALISAANLIESGIIDAAIVGGSDTLCRLSTNGFNSLEALSKEQCRPFSEARRGINIGEAAGLMILSKEPSPLVLMGWGASSDAWHISAPHPEGIGATASMQQALNKAQLTPKDIGYINLHGTGTALNDSAESKAVFNIFQDNVPSSSTKHLTGHTLGAAGITEIGIAALILKYDLPLPSQEFTDQFPKGEDIANIRFAKKDEKIERPIILSNSFAFGGNNASLIIGKNHDL